MIRFILLLAVMMAAYNVGRTQNFSTDDPTSYNNYIVGEQDKLMERVVDYIVQTVHNDNLREVESKRLELIGQIESSIKKLEKLAPFKGSSKMKGEALAVFKLYREAYVNDFSAINMLKANRESSYQAMEKYFDAHDKAEEKLSRTADRFAKAQLDFAQENGMKLTEAASDSTISIISEVNRYSRQVFLEFFKVSKLNGACLDALNKQQSKELEARRLLLEAGVNEAYTALRSMKPYRNDADYQNKALAYVTYHRLFAQKDLKDLGEILGKKDRTEEDVNRYNEVIQSYNKDINNLLNSFNEANALFLKNHIPKATADAGQKG